MKPDLYTKAVLTVIALALSALALSQYLNPKVVAQAQAATFGGVQFSGGDRQGFFDPRTGEVAFFTTSAGKENGKIIERLKLTRVGTALTLICGGGEGNVCK
jgi:hypothetical protein